MGNPFFVVVEGLAQVLKDIFEAVTYGTGLLALLILAVGGWYAVKKVRIVGQAWTNQ